MNQDIYYFAGKRYCLSAVVGLGLGGPEARQKRGPPDDVIILSQP